ncbi:hypothetical protein [Deinococcus ruber]|uniref:Uncharacterized protein n=1 Tax=Deinococcus ruber TaxID=1848197 RepID=A0A918C868_9DEIO|nr:hypothetical protein [Deinococcus ruber]GGR11443.1 hypothetical protein GCM10008957_25310 [Deinococcus ruber]
MPDQAKPAAARTSKSKGAQSGKKAPSTTKNKRSGGGSVRKAIPEKYDWSHWRRLYMRGDESVTLETLSRMEGAPALGTLKDRCADENWRDLRAELRERSTTKIMEIERDLQAEIKRHELKLGDALISVGAQGLAAIQGGKKELEPIDTVRLLKLGTDLKRRAAGMEERTIRWSGIKSEADLDKLKREELWLAAGMVPPTEDEDDI